MQETKGLFPGMGRPFFVLQIHQNKPLKLAKFSVAIILNRP